LVYQQKVLNAIEPFEEKLAQLGNHVAVQLENVILEISLKFAKAIARKCSGYISPNDYLFI